MKKTINSILTIFLFVSTIFAQNTLSLEYLGGDSLIVNLLNDDVVAGFEIKIDGVEIINASGGIADTNGFMLSTSGSTIIGFSLSGESIPVGQHHLFTLHFNITSSIESACFSEGLHGPLDNLPDCVLSTPAGTSIEPLELGPCVAGCFNNTACNFLESGECELPITYYQDADNDELGNSDITQDSCEPIEGWVTNSDDDDDECSGTVSELDGFCCLSTTFDECGVCDGDSSSCADCLGTPNGIAILDACNICNGDGSSCAGCDGISNSGVIEDACGNCGGDCIADNEGKIVCSGISNTPENVVIADCNGVCGGSAAADACNVCDGDGSSCTGCDGISNSGVTVDACGNCGGDCIADNSGLIVCSSIDDIPENEVVADCSGMCGGTAVIDSCDNCVGGDTGAGLVGAQVIGIVELFEAPVRGRHLANLAAVIIIDGGDAPGRILAG